MASCAAACDCDQPFFLRQSNTALRKSSAGIRVDRIAGGSVDNGTGTVAAATPGNAAAFLLTSAGCLGRVPNNSSRDFSYFLITSTNSACRVWALGFCSYWVKKKAERSMCRILV